MAIAPLELLNPVPSADYETADIVHIICCEETEYTRAKAFCGKICNVDFSDLPNDLTCVTCVHLDKGNFCPKHYICPQED